MTKLELDRHLKLRQRLTNALSLLASLEAAAVPGVQVLDGMPRASGICDRVGSLATEIADIRGTITQLEAEVTRSAESITAYISTIPDSMTQMIFRLRFIHGLTWKRVADSVGGGNTECAVKAVCYRYLKNGPPRPSGRPRKGKT